MTTLKLYKDLISIQHILKKIFKTSPDVMGSKLQKIAFIFTCDFLSFRIQLLPIMNFVYDVDLMAFCQCPLLSTADGLEAGGMCKSKMIQRFQKQILDLPA